MAVPAESRLKRIDVISLFPEFVLQAVKFGVVGRAVDRGMLKIASWNPREYTSDVHRTVDDRPYGGGPGMVMMVEPLRRAIHAARASADGDSRTVYLSPRGKRLTQAKLNAVTMSQLILVSGRYEGVDERLLEAEIDEEWSIGDYVLSGGELPAMVVIDAVTRLIPGVLGAQESAEQDSFMVGRLDHPHYTRPELIDGVPVPEVLLSGDHERIRRWRLKQSLLDTLERRPDLLNRALSAEEQSLLAEIASGIESGIDWEN